MSKSNSDVLASTTYDKNRRISGSAHKTEEPSLFRLQT